MLSNIKTPEELLKFMDTIAYGFNDGKDSYLNEEVNDNIDKWHLSSPEQLLKVKQGQCFDQVELEREWFKNNNYQIHTYFMIFALPYQNPFPTHTVLVYEKNKEYYLFEHADYNHRGIYKYNSLEELLSSLKKYHQDTISNQYKMTEEEKNSLIIYEYKQPEYNLNFNEFLEYIFNTGQKIR